MIFWAVLVIVRARKGKCTIIVIIIIIIHCHQLSLSSIGYPGDNMISWMIMLYNRLTPKTSFFFFCICFYFLKKYRRFLQSLPDKGNKVLTTVAKIKELISRREELEETVTQFERMTVSQLVERTRLDSLDIDDGDDDISDMGNKTFVNSSEEKLVSGSDLRDKPDSEHKDTTESKISLDNQTGQNSRRKWDYESCATPPVHKLEVTNFVVV